MKQKTIKHTRRAGKQAWVDQGENLPNAPYRKKAGNSSAKPTKERT